MAGDETSIMERLNKFKKLSGQEYRDKALPLSKQILHSLELRKKICLGEYSVPSLESREGVEKKLCLESLNKMQRAYTKISFDKREEFLRWVYKERMKSLQEQRKKALRN